MLIVAASSEPVDKLAHLVGFDRITEIGYKNQTAAVVHFKAGELIVLNIHFYKIAKPAGIQACQLVKGGADSLESTAAANVQTRQLISTAPQVYKLVVLTENQLRNLIVIADHLV